MSLITQSKEVPETLAQSPKTMMEKRGLALSIIKKHDDEKLWDAIEAKDVDDDLIDYVLTAVKANHSPETIRKTLGFRSNDKRWHKVCAAIRGGTRIETPVLFNHMFRRTEQIAEKLFNLIDTELDNAKGIGAEEEIVRNGRSVTKEKTGLVGKDLAATIDTFQKLQQGIVKTGIDLGVFTDPREGQSGSGQVNIIIKTNVPIPSIEDIEKKRQERQAVIEVKAEEVAKEDESET